MRTLRAMKKVRIRNTVVLLFGALSVVSGVARGACTEPDPSCPAALQIMPAISVDICSPPAGFVDRTTVPSSNLVLEGVVEPASDISVTVGGAPVGIDSSGHFSGVASDSTETAQVIPVEATSAGAGARTVVARKVILHAPTTAAPDSFGEDVGPSALLHFTTEGLEKLGPIFEQRLLSTDFDSKFATNYFDEAVAGIFYRINGNAAQIADIRLQYITPGQPPGASPAMLFAFQLQGLRVDLSAETFTTGISGQPLFRIGGCRGFFEVPALNVSAVFQQFPTSEPGHLEIRQLGESRVTLLGEIAMDLELVDGGADCRTILEGFGPSFPGLRQRLPQDLPRKFQEGLDSGMPRTEIAVATETALNDLRIAGAIGDAVGMQIETKFASIEPKLLESLVYRVFTRMDSNEAAPCTTQFDESWGTVGTVPELERATPYEDLPYDVALAASPSSLNPILTGFAEQGRLSSVIVVSATEAGLCDAVGKCQNPLTPASKLIYHVRPSVPPFVTGLPGPHGTMTELYLPNLLIDIDLELFPDASPLPVARVGVDVVAGLDFVSQKLGSEIGLRIASLEPREVTVHVLDILPFVSRQQVIDGVASAVACRLPGLAQTIGGFQLPPFQGLELRVVDLTGPIGPTPWFVAYFALRSPELVSQTFEVPAEHAVNTGLILDNDTALTVTATGSWSYDGVSFTTPRGIGLQQQPDTLLYPDGRLGSLLGTFMWVLRPGVPTSTNVELGHRYRGTTPVRGTLFLGMNDAEGTYGDNTGSLAATVSYAPPHAIRSIDAMAEWVDTGLDVASGAPLIISAAGTWSNVGPPALGPQGFPGYQYPGTVLASADLAALIGRIGDAVFAIGAEFRGTAPAGGRLYLSINDVPGSFGDNQGFVDADVTSVGLTKAAMQNPPAPLCGGPPATPIPAGCVGDCSADAAVSVDELVRVVNIALGNVDLQMCRAVDADGDGRVSISEIVRAVNAALAGCP